MSPNLEDLAQQASYTVKGANGCVWGTTVNLEKFAELLIRECARISVETDDTMTNQGEASAQAFMKHFGVEE